MPYSVVGSFNEGAGLQPYDDTVAQATKKQQRIARGQQDDPARTSFLGEEAAEGRGAAG